ncbi:MAG: hypothetical protein MZW92_58935 [Comamonadaceae bacterium]|nr:hypothetical protein [Comamonadaceae bacterium]
MSALTASVRRPGRLPRRLVPRLLDGQLRAAAVHADGRHAGLLAGRALPLRAARAAAARRSSAGRGAPRRAGAAGHRAGRRRRAPRRGEAADAALVAGLDRRACSR